MNEPQTAPTPKPGDILDWLARSGYGVDYSSASDEPAPFTRRALAEAYHRVDPSYTVDEWDYVLAHATGERFA